MQELGEVVAACHAPDVLEVRLGLESRRQHGADFAPMSGDGDPDGAGHQPSIKASLGVDAGLDLHRSGPRGPALRNRPRAEPAVARQARPPSPPG